MDKKQVKHGGCKVCGSRDQGILISIMVPGEVMSIAVCDKCLPEVKAGRKK
jgi:ribosome-binding protein aMBF1 (putative translation factor)